MERSELLELIDEAGQDGREVLDLVQKGLRELPGEIGRLSQITELNLGVNQLTTLPSEIGQLSKLESLDLFDNQLRTLPAELARLSNLRFLDLTNNPLPIPPEILARKREPKAIINYYLQTEGLAKKLNEAKMLFVGQGGVGKTSLVKQLIDGTYDRDEAKTEGIDIQPWQIAIDSDTIRLNVWDFGGQEIMHATHQFFLTKRSLYLLVLDARQGEQEGRLEYWLKMIQSFGGEAPIIVVSNKIDQHRLTLDRRALQLKYPNIKAFVNTSCATGEGIKTLKALITREIGQLEHVGDLLPGQWFDIKSQLEQMDADYLPISEYQRLCRQQNVRDMADQRVLIQFLHDLGIVLNFQEDPRLHSTNVLKPEWVTNGVYKILNAQILSDKDGMLERAQLNDILDQERYPPDKHMFLLDMMRKFELLYDFEGAHNEQFLIPDLLPKEQPHFTWDKKASLAFQYHYDVLPSSIISRFIVRMHRHVLPQNAWRRGVVLNNKERNNQALVIADIEDKKISIWVAGTENMRRTFLSIIRDHFEHIHETIPKIEAQEVVPLPDHPHITYPYANLRQLEKRGIRIHYLPEIDAEIDVKQLLDGIESATERQNEAQEPPTTPAPLTSQQTRYHDLTQQKAALDENAHQYAQRMRWRYIGGFTIISLLLIAASFALLYKVDWNLLEPLTWAMGIGGSLLMQVCGYIFAALFGKELSPDAAYQSALAKQTQKEYDRFGFDLPEYQRLEQELARTNTP
ncbi:MAG: COR domain-containing protein [Ardenticatenaceae bacterium]